MTENMENKFEQGSVWLAKVFFREVNDFKVRPIVIVNNELALDIDVIFAPVSSTKARNQFDVILEYWKESGLEKPSIVRTSKIATISGKELMKKLGSLHPHDLDRVLEMCKKLF